MRVHLKQKVTFQKKIYGPGDVEIDVTKLNSAEQKYFHKLISANVATEKKSLPIDTTPELERQKQLGEKFLAEARQPRGPIAGLNSLPDGVVPAVNEEESADPNPPVDEVESPFVPHDQSESSDEGSEGGDADDDDSTSDEDGEESSSETEEHSEDDDSSDAPVKAAGHGKKAKKKKKKGGR